MKKVAIAALMLSMTGACAAQRKSVAGADGVVPAASTTPAPAAAPDSLQGQAVPGPGGARLACRTDAECPGGAPCLDGVCQDRRGGMAACELKQVHFEFNKAEPDAGSMADLDADLSCIRARGLVVVRVEAHCDVRGSNAWNDLLSTRRAEFLREQLAAHGIDAKGVQVVGFGKSQPLVVDATTEEEHRQNRRGVFVTATGAGALPRKVASGK